MASKLLLAPVGAGKTEEAIKSILAITKKNPFACIWVLLATERQIHEFRSRLMKNSGEQRVFFNVEFFTFYDLYSRILETAGQPTRELKEAARLRLLRVLATRMKARGDLTVYSDIAEKAGFIRVVADFIYELKQAIIEPEAFAQVTDDLFGHRAKDIELAELYRTYQERLREHDVVDREGEGWLALARLRNDQSLHEDVDLVVVDGYDQFTPLQAQMIAHLAERVGHMLVTLTTVPGREHNVGQRFVDAQAALEKAYTDVKLTLDVEIVTEPGQQRHPDLKHLADNLQLKHHAQKPSSGGVKFIVTPDVVTETSSVLRAVKRLLLNGTRPEDIIIVLRDYQQYHVHIRNLGRAYGLPLALHLGEALDQTPPILALMDLITLHDTERNVTEFLCRPVMDALRSPYFQLKGLNTEAINTLDLITREYAVVGGRDVWLDAVNAAEEDHKAGEDADVFEKPALIDGETRDLLHQTLSNFFEAITPPEKASLADYIAWIESLIGQDPLNDPEDPENEPAAGLLNMVASLRRTAPAHVINRDLAALDAFKRVLKMMFGAQLLLTTLEQTDDEITWAEFLADLRASVARASINSAIPREGRVLVTTAVDARGLPHLHVFVMGLSEGIFPARVPEDPLYLDSEREQLKERGLLVQAISERARDEGIFYELISLARESLTLSRPTVKDGAPWIESHLWRASMAVFNDAETLVETVPMGLITPIEEAVTSDEIAVAVAHQLNKPQSDENAAGAYNYLIENAKRVWLNVRNGRYIELSRLLNTKPDRYTGIIENPILLGELRKVLSPNHRWSASQLNDYGACPFRFFAGRVLKLEALEAPYIGMDARQLGSLNHSILEETYRTLGEKDIEIKQGNLDKALEILQAIAKKSFADAPNKFGFRQSPVWEQEKDVLYRRLEALVRYDFTEMSDQLTKKFGSSRPRIPYALERRFGIGEQDKFIKIDDETYVRLTGFVDRIDRFGNDVLVLDYKTGTSKISLTELQEGRNFQIMLYIDAVNDMLDSWRGNHPDVPDKVAGGFFWHIRDRKTSGELNTAEYDHQTLINNARNMITSYIQRAKSGDFAVQPSKLSDNGRCTSYCEFYKLCRISVTNPNKMESREF